MRFGRAAAVAVLAAAVLVAASVAVILRATSTETGVKTAAPSPTSTSPSTTKSTATTSVTPPPATTPGGAAWMQTTHQLGFGGLSRSYLLVRPPTAGARLPIVVVLHGRGATPELEETRTGFPSVTGPAVLAYPRGYGLFWNAGACCGTAQTAGIDDVGFVAAVVKDVQKSNPDTSGGPVFLVGYSNGGKLAYRVACAEPGPFKAVAAVGAVAVAPCAQPKPVPFIEVAYAGDPELAFGAAPPIKIDGYTELNVDVQVQQRAAANGCTGSSSTTQGSLETTTWNGCPTGQAVELAVYRGATHVWPVGDSQTPPAQAVIWRFFRNLAS